MQSRIVAIEARSCKHGELKCSDGGLPEGQHVLQNVNWGGNCIEVSKTPENGDFFFNEASEFREEDTGTPWEQGIKAKNL